MKYCARFTLAPLLIIGAATTFAAAQSPFQFREAYFLERRLQDIGIGYSVDHPQHLFHTGPDLMNQTAIDSGAVSTYASPMRMQPLLSSIDDIRRSGALEVAEVRYREFIEMIRKAQGPDTSDEALVLDHLGEFYLEMRDFERAYQTFSEALRVRRVAVERARNDPNDARRVDPQFKPGQLHLADLLTQLGQLDLARGDLEKAEAKLKEATIINNTPGYLHYVNRLDPIYFESLVLEKQQKWQEAEGLWKDAIARRTNMGHEPYWEAMKEYAAFLARWGNFRSAAKIVQQIITGTSGGPLKVAAPAPYWIDSRARTDRLPILRGGPDGRAIYYENESNHAMLEILAMDRWITDGPAAAAPLIRDAIDSTNDFFLARGSDADLLRLYSWFEKKVFMQMSILLDGNPTPERVAQAYQLLSRIQGRYLATLADLNRQMDQAILDPGVSGDKMKFPQLLADSRERYANAFLSLALGDNAITAEQFLKDASTERMVREAAASLCLSCADGRYSYRLAADAALLDFTLWNRIDRKNPTTSVPEYGAFVLREGRPTAYIRLGSAEEIDRAADELQREVDGFFQARTDRPAELKHKLQSLYSLILAPAESSLEGVSRLLVIPDGQLSMVPMGALMDRQGHYFLERHTVTYLSSVIQIAKSDTTSAPVIMADPDFNLVLPGSPELPSRKSTAFKPLPGAEREARYVAEALHVSPNRILIGKSAREDLLRSIRSPEILHLATHSDPFLRARLPAGQFPKYDLFEFPGLWLTQDPFLHSVIALAGANRPQAGPEDGLLSALEVASMHLAGTKLVVLSSCQSANGKLVDGQGIPGLRAAFSAAGARALLMNLWPVDDEAGFQFMQFFYSHLSLGQAEAMRQAQLYMLNTTNYKNPLYWAGYTYSDNDALVPEPALQEHSSITDVQSPPNASGTEMSIAPRCFQFKGHSSETNGLRLDIRMNLARVARTLTGNGTNNGGFYNLELPGNDITVSRIVNDKQVPYDTPYKPAATLIIQKMNGITAITLRVLPSNLMMVLEGPSGLLPTVDLPETFPPLSSYNSAGASSFDGPLVIDSFGACGSEPSKQSSDSKNQATTPDKSVPTSDARAKRENSGARQSTNPVKGANAPSAEISAASIPAYELLQLRPRCFQLSGVSSAYHGLSIRLTARIMLLAARTRRISDNNTIAYELNLPENEVSITPEVDGKPASGGVSSSETDILMMFVEREAESSTLVLQIGNSKPANYIILKGPANLFPTFDIPKSLPPPSSYTDARVVLQDQTAAIDRVSECIAEPSHSQGADRSENIKKYIPAEGLRSKQSTPEIAISTESKTKELNAQGKAELMIAPRCFQFSGIANISAGFTTRFTARLTLGGVVQQLLHSEQISVYDIQHSGNEVAIVYDINGTQMPDRYSASNFEGATLTVRKEKSSSTFSVGVSGFPRDWITLKGSSSLFSPESIPETIPPLSSYTEATVMGAKIDTIGFCGSAPLVQYNDGIIRSTLPRPPATVGSTGNKNEIPAPSPNSSAAATTANITSADPNLNLARRVLSYALHGDTQSVFQNAAPQANKAAIAAMVTFLSGSVKEMEHCRMEVETIEVHKILWAGKSGLSVPAYVAIGDCEKARPRLLIFIDPNGLITRTGTGGFVSKSTTNQIEQKAQALAEFLLRSEFATFSKNLSPALEGQSQNIPGIVNAVVQNLGGFERIVASQKYPYADIVVVTALYQRGAISVEILFDPSLKIARWYVQAAGKPRYFWQEFWDIK